MSLRRALLLSSLPLLVAGCPEKRGERPGAPEPGASSRRPPDVPLAGALAQKIRYEQAKSLLRAGKPDLAIREFERAIAADPKGKMVANCYLGLGSARGDLGQHDHAVQAFRRVVALEPSDPEAHRALAIGLEDAGLLREARESLERALALDPRQLSAYQDLAALYLKANQMDGAKKTYLRYELARTALVQTLGLSANEEEREAAAVALGDARDEATAKALGLALTDRSGRVRLAAIRALGQQRLAEGAGPLRALLAITRDAEERRLIHLSLQAIAAAAQPPAQPAPSLVNPPDVGAGR